MTKLPPAQWLVLSDRPPEPFGAGPVDDLVERGLFVIELALPLTEAAVLLDFHALDGWPRTFTLFHDPMAGFVLIHRQGQSVARHELPGPLPAQAGTGRPGTGRLTLKFDAPRRVWTMRFDCLDEDGENQAHLVSQGGNPLPIRPDDLDGLSQGASRQARHPAVLWFGLTRADRLPAHAPWIGQRTPLNTARGVVLAGHLVPGDLIATEDGGLLPLRRATRLDLPACGSFAPVVLRAPFFGVSHDLLVAFDQRVVIAGPEVEDLFGEDEVLIEAGSLVDGRSALAEQRRAVVSVLMLEFDHPTLVVADGCRLLIARSGDLAPRRVLHTYEILTLMSHLGRSGRRRVA